MFRRKANTVTVSLIHFTRSGPELLFLIPRTLHLQEDCILERRDGVSRTFVCRLSQSPLERTWVFLLSAPVMVQRNLLSKLPCSSTCLLIMPCLSWEGAKSFLRRGRGNARQSVPGTFDAVLFLGDICSIALERIFKETGQNMQIFLAKVAIKFMQELHTTLADFLSEASQAGGSDPLLVES